MENLGVDIKLLIAQLINFGLFFYIFKRYISVPFTNFVKQEVKRNEEKENALAQAKKIENELADKEAEMIKKMKKQSFQVLADAKKEAQETKEKILQETQKEIEVMRANARKQVANEIELAQREIEKKIIELSSIAVNKTLQQNLDETMKKQLTEKVLNSLGRIN
jgi:F-type H+-transporting ATPase subunit b